MRRNSTSDLAPKRMQKKRVKSSYKYIGKKGRAIASKTFSKPTRGFFKLATKIAPPLCICKKGQLFESEKQKSESFELGSLKYQRKQLHLYDASWELVVLFLFHETAIPISFSRALLQSSGVVSAMAWCFTHCNKSCSN